ncbi:MAG: amidase [Acidobacteriota bacterium]|jgi:amidase
MPEDRRPDHSEAPENREQHRRPDEGVSRRSFLRWTAAAAGAGASLSTLLPGAPAGAAQHGDAPAPELEEATIAELQAMLEGGELSAADLVDMYLDRIDALDREGPGLNSIIETNPDARRLAERRDRERMMGQVRGPLHGIPIILKDNIDTGDRMMTTAGSLALMGASAHRDARAVWKLRRAGAIILGKAGLSEWANFRGFDSSSGWSGRGGQVRNPYVLDRNPCGSSSGSAAAVSASLCAAALGTETDGSVVCPASACGVVGIKPTVGLVSRSGVVPIAASQDTIGVHGRTVADAATVLGPMTGGDLRDPATFASAGNFFEDYTQFVDPDGLVGARIGVMRDGVTGGSAEADAIFEEAIQAMEAAGAVIVDPANPPNVNEFFSDQSEIIVLVYEFKRDLNAYLATRTGVPVSTMADVIQFNLDHADEELQYFGQEWFELAEMELFDEPTYLAAVERGPRLAGPEGIDAIMDQEQLDAIIAPTGSPAWTTDLVNGDLFLTGSSSYAAVAGYPNVTVPAGFSFGLPVGVSFFGRAWSEPTLIRVASGFEAATGVRTAPEFLPALPLPTVQDRAGLAAPPSAEALAEALTSGSRGSRVRRARYL